MTLKVIGQLQDTAGQWYTCTSNAGVETYTPDARRAELPIVGNCKVEATGQLTIWRTDRQPGPPPWGDKPW